MNENTFSPINFIILGIMQKVAGERYVYKFVCDPEALFALAFGAAASSSATSASTTVSGNGNNGANIPLSNFSPEICGPSSSVDGGGSDISGLNTNQNPHNMDNSSVGGNNMGQEQGSTSHTIPSGPGSYLTVSQVPETGRRERDVPFSLGLKELNDEFHYNYGYFNPHNFHNIHQQQQLQQHQGSNNQAGYGAYGAPSSSQYGGHFLFEDVDQLGRYSGNLSSANMDSAR